MLKFDVFKQVYIRIPLLKVIKRVPACIHKISKEHVHNEATLPTSKEDLSDGQVSCTIPPSMPSLEILGS